MAAPLNLAAGVRTQYIMPTFGALTENHLKAPFDAASMYDGTKFIGRSLIDTYIIRMRFFGVSSVMNNNIEIDLDIANQARTYLTERFAFHPSAGVAIPFNVNFVTHIGPVFMANGALVYLTADSAAQIYGVLFSVIPVTIP